MPKVELLSQDVHADAKVDTGFSNHFDDVRNIASVIAGELPHLVLDYPVFITKNNETGEFELSALLGFSAKENLFIKDGGYCAEYVPLDIRRQPFQVCFVSNSHTGTGTDAQQKNVKIGINTTSNRLSKEHGEALFKEGGAPSDYVTRISDILGALMSGLHSTKFFLKILADNDLIEPVQLNVNLHDVQPSALSGLYTVNSEKLMALTDVTVVEFHRKNYLQSCHAIIHSMGHMEKLLKWKKAKHSGSNV